MTEPARRSVASSVPMEPTRNPDVSLSDLITVLLDKGTYLNVDLIIAVADIPLIGINLRATIAGMETMLEYGMMRDWDEKTRAWVRTSVARHFPLAPGEEVVAKMAGGHFQETDSITWRPGGVYITNQRLVVFRREPRQVLWETDLACITALRLSDHQTVGAETRTRLLIDTSDGSTTMLSASAPQRVRELIARDHPHVHVPQEVIQPASDPQRELTSHAWYQEARAGGDTWRGGSVIADQHRLIWQAPTDARPAVNLDWKALTGVAIVDMKAPSGQGSVLRLTTDHGVIHLGFSQPQQWLQLLTAQLHQAAPEKEGTHVGN